MPECRLSRQILYGELKDGTRSIGAPKKLFKDQIKTTLKICNIPVDQLEALATDRSTWRSTVRQAVDTFEAARTNIRIEQRNRRHERMARGPVIPAQGIPCPTCGRICASEFGLSHQKSHRQRN